ncbi:MAG TPA: hypothetical protein VMV93_09595 [Chloroflexota bacterium]|nr:hypothetical protein [Chloroflexota bacterium]
MAQVVAMPRPASWALTATSDPAGAATLSVPAPAAGAGLRHLLSALAVCWGGGSYGGGDVQVWDGAVGTGNLLFAAYLGPGSQSWSWPNPLPCTVGNPLNIVAAGGGAGITMRIAASGPTAAISESS